MTRWLFALGLLTTGAALAYRWQRQKQAMALPTAEHKKQAWQKWCLCQNPLPRMQADHQFYCQRCSFLVHDWQRWLKLNEHEEQRRREALSA